MLRINKVNTFTHELIWQHINKHAKVEIKGFNEVHCTSHYQIINCKRSNIYSVVALLLFIIFAISFNHLFLQNAALCCSKLFSIS